MSVKINRVTWSLQDDVVYNNPCLSLYATGCRWNCKGCYNKELWNFRHPDSKEYSVDTIIEYIKSREDILQPKDVTVVGMGGDFYFQLPAWVAFTQKLKAALPEVKLVWYTGAEYTTKLLKDVGHIDAILWGMLKPKEGKVYKTITEAKTNHLTTGELFINDYDPTHEDPGELTDAVYA